MKTLTNKKILIALITGMLLSLSAPTFADDSTSASPGSPAVGQKHHRHWREMKKVFQECAAANDITLPAKGSGEKLSSADRTAIKACVKEYHETLRSCLQSSNVEKPQPGQPPTALRRSLSSNSGVIEKRPRVT